MEKEKGGFTLVEIMVVVAVVGMLMAGLFKLISATGENTKKARTVARLQRIQNALAGFYAENGTYPPVQRFSSTNPYLKHPENYSWNENDGEKYVEAGGLYAENANRAAAAQSVEFLFPCMRSLDDFCEQVLHGPSANVAKGNKLYQNNEDVGWDRCKIFKFGLVSYLLPRIELMGGLSLVYGDWGYGTPAQNFFFGNDQTQTKSTNYQWSKNNTGTLRAVYEREQRQCARWMPHLEGCVYGYGTLFGESVRDSENDKGGFHFKMPEGTDYWLQRVSLKDGWGNDFYYYSAPPYQSYRLWSAGPDGKTFPPWITLEALKKKNRSTNNKKDVDWARDWMEDDIVRFDR